MNYCPFDLSWKNPFCCKNELIRDIITLIETDHDGGLMMSFESNIQYPKDTEARYRLLVEQCKSMIEGERNRIANLANVAALLFHGLEDLNWAGFYLVDHKELVLGPFQGKPACIRIPIGRGVCGTAAASKETQRIKECS
jgi:putative methionine-R-sulfoxide reductase with GAF domain